MMEARLQTQLGALAEMHRRTGRNWALALCWSLAAATGFALCLFESSSDWEFHKKFWVLPLIVGLVAVCIALVRQKTRANEIQDLIRALEPLEPEIQHLLTTAAEQKPAETSGAFSFLQMRVIEEVLAHPRQPVWQQGLKQRLASAQIAQAVALLALAASVLALNLGATRRAVFSRLPVANEITVTPGDAQVERGTGLVIAARFGGALPAEATLVLNTESGKQSRFPMTRQLADPIFGASVPEISEAGIYHIEYGTKKTRDYKISIFEFPALVRADADLSYPVYTGLTNRTIRDTLRVSAVQGSHLSYTLQLNKPVARARLAGKERTLALTTQSNAIALLPEIILTNSAHYSLELVDADGRSNKFATDFFIQALTNQRPQVNVVFPRGDPRVSRLEELQLQAEASDDFGLLKYGVGFGVAGQEPRFIELGQSTPANTKKQFGYLIPLEKLGVEADQAVAYFAWADDYGPDGKTRRTFSDMFFAEVRPFDEIFRQDESGAGENGSQGGGQGGSGSERTRLAELQKQIVVATWNLQREKSGAGAAPHP